MRIGIRTSTGGSTVRAAERVTELSPVASPWMVHVTLYAPGTAVGGRLTAKLRVYQWVPAAASTQTACAASLTVTPFGSTIVQSSRSDAATSLLISYLTVIVWPSRAFASDRFSSIIFGGPSTGRMFVGSLAVSLAVLDSSPPETCTVLTTLAGTSPATSTVTVIGA